MWRRIKELPLGMRLYTLFWTLFLPAGVILVLAGAVVPGLVLLVLFVIDQAVFTPLIVARSQRQHRAKRQPPESPLG
jgi:Flp pilus assembly protein TadB